MIRIAYPAAIDGSLLVGFPNDVEFIPVHAKMEETVEVDIWIPEFNPTLAMRTWPHLRGVRLVLSLMAGTEWIPSTVGPHVTVCNARGAHNVSTAEWTIGAILAMMKHFPFFMEMQREASWKRRSEANEEYVRISGDTRPNFPPVMIEDLAGKTVLLIGHGSIGKDIELMLQPFHVNLIRMARTARENPKVHAVTELNHLLPQADVVVLILPSTAESRHLISAHQMSLMRQGCLLVNAARGPIVDTDALVAALQSGRIRAAIDVTDPEPLPDGHPLWSCPNLLITPHVGGSSPNFTPRALAITAAQVRRYIAGEPLENVVQAAV
ncbi:MAG: 2-hydroxyacid dehydrogenase [Acidobacteriota bacterium]|nr:2-hydroxyacid dehydrogenase [Acidobacteriota bacterium]